MRYYFLLIVLVQFFCSCGSYFNQPVVQEEARTGETTSFSNKLENLPLPDKPVVVGVYNFRDQTGQYKNIENGSSFSTAVTQGATSILVKALEDSRWFTPIERENLSNLLNERNIIRSTRQEYVRGGNPNEPQLPPLLYAGVILEGGIVSYDSNIITGGLGARYFGVGGATQYRQDRITVYLRAISTSNGKIIKTVYVSKTILSQAIDVNLFRYVNFQRLLEVETGYTKNEPVQLAVKEAIEKAVESLIVEGIQDNLWKTLNPEEGDNLVKKYNIEKEEEELTKLYNRKQLKKTTKNSFGFSFGANYFHADFNDKKFGFTGRAEYVRNLSPVLGVSVSGNILELRTGKSYENLFASADLNLQASILPNDNFGPFIYGGAGYLLKIQEGEDFTTYEEDASYKDNFIKLQYGGGIRYDVSERFQFKLFAEHHLMFSDQVDHFENGKLDDQYFNFGIGIDYKFGKQKERNKSPIDKINVDGNNEE